MKNKINLLLVAALCLVYVMSCGLASRLEKATEDSSKKTNSGSTNPDGKSLEDKAIDATLGGEKIGIPECDELFEHINQLAESKDDNYVTRATRDFFLSKIRESIKESIEKDKGDKVKMAKNCKEFADDLDKYKGKEDDKK